jgi:hypothetical protein
MTTAKTWRAPDDVYERLREAAYFDRVPQNRIIDEAVEQWLDRRTMTDREALEELLHRFGLTPYTGQPLDGQPDDEFAIRPEAKCMPDDNEVVLVAKVGGVGGYSNFHAEFDFSLDGTFKSLHIWE